MTGHPPHGTKPDRQRRPRILENRSCRYRYLIAATRTLPEPRSERPSFGVIAARTPKPFWPAQAEQILSAGLLAAKPRFEFRKSPGIVLHHLFHGSLHYLLWSPESSRYPSEAKIMAESSPYVNDKLDILVAQQGGHYYSIGDFSPPVETPMTIAALREMFMEYGPR